MGLPNSPISGFPLYSLIKKGYWLAMDDMDRLETVRVDVKEFLSSPTTQNFEWVTDNDPGYALNDVVTHDGKWWQSLIADNLNIPPGSDPTKWHELPKSASGFVPWAAGVYPQDLPFVYVNLGTLDNPIIKMYVLASPVRPYVSTDITLEAAAGDWLEWPQTSAPAADIGPFVFEDLGNGSQTDFSVPGYSVTRIVTVFLNGVQKKLGVDYTISGVSTVVFTVAPTLAQKVAIMFMGTTTTPGGMAVLYDTGDSVFYDDGVTEVEYAL